MGRLVILLGRDRDRCGAAALYSSKGQRLCGPFDISSRSSDNWAAANGNPSRNPLFRVGDAPTGEYRVREILRSGRGTAFDRVQFGPNGVVVLDATSGDAALAEANGRFHTLIVGGEETAKGELRSTAGSFRLSDRNLKVLIAALRKLPSVSCTVEETDGVKSRTHIFNDPRCEQNDPIDLQSNRGRNTRRPINKELLIGGAAGAMALEVVFIAVPATPARASQTPIVQQVAHDQDGLRLPLPKTQPASGYVKLAYNLPTPNEATTSFNVDKFVNTMDANAAPSYKDAQGNCSQACLDGLKAGGEDITNVHGKGKDFGGIVEAYGFKEVGQSSDASLPGGAYSPQKGDVAVFDGNKSHPNGHVQVFDGKGWVSDFKNKPDKYSPYSEKTTPPSTVYRHP